MKLLQYITYSLLLFKTSANFISGASYIPPYTDEDDVKVKGWKDKVQEPRPKQCLCLVLSDSLNLGPYQAGVIKGIVHEYKNSGLSEYQVVSGVSLGAINAHIFSQYEAGDEVDAAKALVKFWEKLAEANKDLVQSWSWGMLYGFYYENSLYNADNLYKFIDDYFHNTRPRRHINLGITNVLNGQFKSFQEHHTSQELIQVLKASISFPGVFKAVEAFDSIWFTGNSVYEIDVIQPINHCRDLGYEDRDIVVDAIVSGNPQFHHVLAKFYNAFSVAARTFETQSYYERMFGLLRARDGHPEVQFRNVLGPQREMANKIVPVQFTKKEVDVQIQLGYKDAKLYFAQQKDREAIDTHTGGGPIVQSGKPKPPFYCRKNKRYANPEKHKRYLELCGFQEEKGEF